MSTSALERKTRSEAILAAEGIPFIKHLPHIEDESEATLCTASEVAIRALCLYVVSYTAGMRERIGQAKILELVRQFELEPDFSPQEAAFIANENPTQKESINAEWRIESCWVMLWALNYVKNLQPPYASCDLDQIIKIITSRQREQLIAEANLRPVSEILDEADLIYRYHWAVVDARLKGQEPPGRLHPSVVFERHYALNWLIQYDSQTWDNVDTST